MRSTTAEVLVDVEYSDSSNRSDKSGCENIMEELSVLFLKGRYSIGNSLSERMWMCVNELFARCTNAPRHSPSFSPSADGMAKLEKGGVSERFCETVSLLFL